MKTKEFPYKNAYEYLEATGILQTGSEKQIQEARGEFRRVYLRHYQKQYDNNHWRVTLCFTHDQKAEIQDMATNTGKKTATLLKEIVFLAVRNDYSSVSTSSEKCRQVEILLSLCFDIVEEILFEHPQFKPQFEHLLIQFKKIKQILKL